MLEAKHLWALNDDDFDSADKNGFDLENEIKMTLDSKLGEKSFLHSILESKFIAIKLKMMNKRESSAKETIHLHEKDPDFIRNFLAHLRIHEIINSELRTNLIDSILLLLKKHSNSIDIQQNALKAFESLFYSIEKDSIECINPEQLEKVIDIILTAMELYPNHQQLQKSALIVLYNEQVLKNLTEKYKCIKLAMDSLVNFKKTDMNLMASVICTTHLIGLSIKERSDLGSNNNYISTLLEIIKSRVHFYSYLYLIENTLSTLVNFLVDSSNNISIFMELGGLSVSFSLLEVRYNKFNQSDLFTFTSKYFFKTFVGNYDIEFRILGLLYNLAEFAEFKNDLLQTEFIEILR
jgi:Zyg-11 family protein